MSTEDNKYDSLRSKLKSLPKVRAKSNFNERLFARISETQQGKVPAVQKESRGNGFSISRILDGLFRPAFVPALGLTVLLIAAIVVYYGYFAEKKDTSQQVEYSSSQNDKREGFVIYVRNDKEYPKNEIASLESNDKVVDGTVSLDETRPAPMETKSDFYAPKTEDPGLRNDKVSEEQRIEMQRSMEKEPMKIDDRRKGDDSKDYKMEKKAPSNYREDKGYPNQNIDGMNQESKTESKQDEVLGKKAESSDEKINKEDSINTGKISDKELKKSKSSRDSTKTKKPVETDDKLKEEQKQEQK